MSDANRSHKRKHSSEHQNIQESCTAKRKKVVPQLLDHMHEDASDSLSDNKPTSEGNSASDSGPTQIVLSVSDNSPIEEDAAIHLALERDTTSSPEVNEISNVMEVSENDSDTSDKTEMSCLAVQLPPEVLEEVFSYVPLLDLMLNCRKVCKTWNEVISREKFLKWKKLYYKLKSGQVDKAKVDVELLLNKEAGDHTQDWLQRVSRIVEENFQHLAPRLEKYVKDRLHHHPQYSCVRKILQLRQKEETALRLIPPLVICSSSVYEVQGVIRAMLPNFIGARIPPPYSSADVLEIFYLLASLLFHLWTHCVCLPPRFHYNLFYALNVFENRTITGTPGHSGQQSIWRYISGSGTCMQPGSQFLKRSVKEHATKGKFFSSNVTIDTFHGFANKALKFSVTFKHEPYSNISAWQVARCIDMYRRRTGVHVREADDERYRRARDVLRTLQKFIASDDSQIIPGNHIPKDTLSDPKNSGDYMTWIESVANYIWEKLIDPEDSSMKITYDGYLKLYQLREPTISDCDCILVDEAQDLTPAETDILMRQRCAKILVGDPHQHIYSFRGAENSMHLFEGPTFYLTKSHRFGPEIAYVAFMVLHTLKTDETTRAYLQRCTLTGGLQHGRVTGDQYGGQVAIVARKNTTLFDRMVQICCSGGRHVKVGFAGGIGSYGFHELLDIHHLWKGNAHKIKQGSRIKKFKNFGKLVTYARAAEDYSLLAKIKICTTYEDRLPEHVTQIKKQAVKRDILKNAEIVFSTAHKAKGLEFETVKITNDFLEQQRENEDDPSDDHINLLYVAITRAKQNLVMSSKLLSVLHHAKEHFIFPRVTMVVEEASDEPENESSSHCCVCDLTKPMPKILMERRHIKCCGETVFPGGLVCKSCLSEKFSCMAKLVNDV